MSKSYTLHIDIDSSKTIPPDSLQKYMLRFAELLGYEDSVKFQRLNSRSGMMRLVVNVDEESAKMIASRLAQADCGIGDPNATLAYAEIDRMCDEDRASGLLWDSVDENACTLIAFPAANRTHMETVGPFEEEDSLDGVLTQVGGSGQTARMRLQDGQIIHSDIESSREIARKVAIHFSKPVRLFGSRFWLRNGHGNWIFQKFHVKSFSEIE